MITQTNSEIAARTTPSNIFSALPADMQMILLRADMKTVRQARGPLRQMPWVRAHFQNRLTDIRTKQREAVR